jgi:hypothetical protein
MPRSLNDALARTLQGGAQQPDGDTDAPLVPKQESISGERTATQVLRNVASSKTASRSRYAIKPVLGACVTAQIIGGKA